MAIRTADSYASSSSVDTNAIRTAHAWISLFLGDKPLSDMRRIAEWQAWATRKLSAGWMVDAIKQSIADAWARHAAEMGMTTANVAPGSPLAEALREAYQAADGGQKPHAIAVFYRSLANEFREHSGWLARFAAIFADMGEQWREPTGYTANGW
jgi:hypothetical protein